MNNNNNKTIIYWVGVLILVGIALAYVFWSKDLIPDTLVKAPMGAALAFLDDIVVMLAMIFVWRKWKLTLFKKDSPQKLKIFHMGALIVVIAFTLFYVFWGVDLIPSNIPLMGYIDDAIVVLLGIYTAGKLRQRAFPKG